MSQKSTPKFDEKILYKTHQHWIVPTAQSLKYTIFGAFPIGLFVYFVSMYSIAWTIGALIFSILLISIYQHYLWRHSWLFIGNQKVTLSVRNGIFSQYAMNIRYRNIRDCAVSKHNFLSFLFKYGTIFVRSSANEGDFHAEYVPKVGKVYALVNALSRYSDDERSEIESIEGLHAYHSHKEATSNARTTLHSHG